MEFDKTGSETRNFDNLPLYPKERKQWVGWRYEDRGGKKPSKPPMQSNGHYARTDDPSTWTSFEEAVAGYSAGRFDGIGIVLAKGDGLVGLDLDNCINSDGTIFPAAQEIVDRFGIYTEISPSGSGLRCLGFGKPVRSGRKVTQEGFAIEVYDGSSPRFLTLTGNVLGVGKLTKCQDALDWLYERYWATVQPVEVHLAQRNGSSTDLSLIRSALNVIPPDDYQTWIDVGFALKSADVDCQIWDEWSQSSEKYVDGECQKKWLSLNPSQITLGTLFHYAKQHGFKFQSKSSSALNDIGNAERFVRYFGDQVRWCAQWKRWIVWTGTSWSESGDERVLAFAKETARRIWQEAADCTNDEQRPKIAAWAKTSSSAQRLDAMMKLSKPDLLIEPDALDRDPMKFNCINGTVDLKTGLLLPHRKSDFITKQSQVRFDPAAKAPRFEQFLVETFASDELTGYVQRALGYSVTGDVSEQLLFICIGDGSNGKSTLFNAVRDILGDYAQEASPGLLEAKQNGGGANEDVARLKGIRLCTTIELNRGVKLDEAKIKHLTGGDRIAARFLYGHTFEFDPTHKLFIISNHKPHVPASAKAMWRRIVMLPFNRQVPPHRKDKHLPGRLRAEYEGILAWLVRGCLLWQEQGLANSEEVANATAAYEAEMDVVSKFIDDCCTVDKVATVQASVLVRRYHAWCDEVGEVPVDGKAFAKELEARGFTKRKTSGVFKWKGIKMMDDIQPLKAAL